MKYLQLNSNTFYSDKLCLLFEGAIFYFMESFLTCGIGWCSRWWVILVTGGAGLHSNFRHTSVVVGLPRALAQSRVLLAGEMFWCSASPERVGSLFYVFVEISLCYDRNKAVFV